MYADQPTGLGPEIVQMDVDPEEVAIRWMDAMRAWKSGEGGRGGALGWWWERGLGSERLPPGVRDLKPWTSPLYENVTVEALVRPARSKGKRPDTFGRDYLIRNTAYYLRPEVRDAFFGAEGRGSRMCSQFFSLFAGSADDRVVVYPMANDR